MLVHVDYKIKTSGKKRSTQEGVSLPSFLRAEAQILSIWAEQVSSHCYSEVFKVICYTNTVVVVNCVLVLIKGTLFVSYAHEPGFVRVKCHAPQISSCKNAIKTRDLIVSVVNSFEEHEVI